MSNLNNIDQFKADGEKFFRTLLSELDYRGISISNLKADHLCFRVETIEQYDVYKRFLSKEGLLLTESVVNGRPIATFSLFVPFTIDKQKIDLVELPSPKRGTGYKVGFEHAEFVINESFDSFIRRHPGSDFTVSGNKNLNPELCLKTKQGQVKFHHLSLDRIIEIEEASIKDLIFDLDGTLIESRDAIYEINQIVFSKLLGRNVSIEESKQKFHSNFSKLFDSFGINCPEERAQGTSTWGVVSEQFTYKLYEGVKGLLQRLRRAGFNLHLWTARDEKSALKILASHDLHTIFETMSFGSNVSSKPDSENLSYNWTLSAKNSILVIGDSPSDILGSKNINAIGAAALWDSHTQMNTLMPSGP